MKLMMSILIAIVFVFSPAVAWSVNDYSLEYAAIDLTGGHVSGAVNPVEDMITADLQGLCEASSQTYNVTSVLCWPAPISAATNWTIYQ